MYYIKDLIPVQELPERIYRVKRDAWLRRFFPENFKITFYFNPETKESFCFLNNRYYKILFGDFKDFGRDYPIIAAKQSIFLKDPEKFNLFLEYLSRRNLYLAKKLLGDRK